MTPKGFLRITIKQSKTDPFRKGIDLYVGCTGTDICPVAAVLDYLQCRGMSLGALFILKDSCPLTRSRFVELVQDARYRPGQVLQPWLSNRSGHNCGIKRYIGLCHKDPRPVEKPSISPVRAPTQGAASRICQPAGFAVTHLL